MHLVVYFCYQSSDSITSNNSSPAQDSVLASHQNQPNSHYQNEVHHRPPHSRCHHARGTLPPPLNTSTLQIRHLPLHHAQHRHRNLQRLQPVGARRPLPLGKLLPRPAPERLHPPVLHSRRVQAQRTARPGPRRQVRHGRQVPVPRAVCDPGVRYAECAAEGGGLSERVPLRLFEWDSVLCCECLVGVWGRGRREQ